jgi:hypothetical protein
MAEWWSLTDLACRAPDASRTLARLADDRRLSHADFVRRVGCWQSAFAVQAAPEWALYLNDPFEFGAAVLAAWHAGKTVVLPGDDRPATIQSLRDLGCALAGDLPGGLQAADDVVDDVATNRSPIDLQLARMKVYTSGSQGVPEAIDKRLDQLVSELEALEAAFGPMIDAEGEAPTLWATVSHQHIYGLLFLVLWPLSAGRPLSTRRLLYPEDMAACLGPAPSVLVATPAHLKRLGDQLDWQAARQGLRAVFSSGGPLPFDASRGVADTLGQVPIEVFGSSETGGIAWRQCASATEPWRPFADVHWRLENGCLSVKSPRLPDASAWWQTSDRAEPAGAGGFRLLGRADRIVKIEEKRVSLSAIERHLLATPWVQEAKALVVGTVIGPRVAVVAVPTPAGRELADQGKRVLSDALRQSLAELVEAIALPRRWRFVKALPINAQGKTPEALLAALFTDAQRPEMPTVQWQERSDLEALATLDIHAGLSVFDGHFEVAPILPGVAQVHWALTLGRECFTVPDHFVRLEALKFVRPVQPGTALKLALQFKPYLADPTLCSLTFKLYSHGADPSDQRDHASGRAIWAYPPSEEGAAHA